MLDIKFEEMIEKFKCDCEFHIIEVNRTYLPFSSEPYIGLSIYNHCSEKTGKLYKRPKEMGTVVLTAKEAEKFLKFMKKELK